MTRFLATLILGATVLGLAACSGGGGVASIPPAPQLVQGAPNPDGGVLPPNH